MPIPEVLIFCLFDFINDAKLNEVIEIIEGYDDILRTYIDTYDPPRIKFYLDDEHNGYRFVIWRPSVSPITSFYFPYEVLHHLSHIKNNCLLEHALRGEIYPTLLELIITLGDAYCLFTDKSIIAEFYLDGTLSGSSLLFFTSEVRNL
ncbi:hypothetical protein HZS_3072 [Henneguya salminicola]|nr:hypothetical protein HZS_3072 [Henneguya salminicola]